MLLWDVVLMLVSINITASIKGFVFPAKISRISHIIKTAYILTVMFAILLSTKLFFLNKDSTEQKTLSKVCIPDFY